MRETFQRASWLAADLRKQGPWRAFFHVLRAVLAAIVLGTAGLAAAQPPARVVHVIQIEGTIDLGLVPYVQRVLDEAAAAQAAAVVLRVNTFGGRVDAAVQIRDALLSSPVRTVAFVDRRAISAGALISLAAENIVMAGGGTIGAATPVQLGQPGAPAQPVQEKTVSYVRKEFRATAESRNRPPLIAEAMVDADVVIPDVSEKGKLLTLTTDEALAHGIADARADTLERALNALGMEGAELRHTSLNWAEQVVRVLTDPVVSSLLMTIAMVGILVELRTPGFGLPGALGVASLGLFLWGHWLVQLVGWEEMLLALGGIALLLLEFFVIPGFGIAGVLGILALVAGLVLSLLGSGENTPGFVMAAASRVVFALLLALAASVLLMRFLPRLPFGKALVLDTGLHAGSGYTSAPATDAGWLGREGRAVSPLRPAGIADIAGERVDVVSDGDFIAAGERLVVVRVDGNRIVVKRASTTVEGEQA